MNTNPPAPTLDEEVEGFHVSCLGCGREYFDWTEEDICICDEENGNE